MKIQRILPMAAIAAAITMAGHATAQVTTAASTAKTSAAVDTMPSGVVTTNGKYTNVNAANGNDCTTMNRDMSSATPPAGSGTVTGCVGAGTNGSTNLNRTTTTTNGYGSGSMNTTTTSTYSNTTTGNSNTSTYNNTPSYNNNGYNGSTMNGSNNPDYATGLVHPANTNTTTSTRRHMRVGKDNNGGMNNGTGTSGTSGL